MTLSRILALFFCLSALFSEAQTGKIFLGAGQWVTPLTKQQKVVQNNTITPYYWLGAALKNKRWTTQKIPVYSGVMWFYNHDRIPETWPGFGSYFHDRKQYGVGVWLCPTYRISKRHSIRSDILFGLCLDQWKVVSSSAFLVENVFPRGLKQLIWGNIGVGYQFLITPTIGIDGLAGIGENNFVLGLTYSFDE